MIDPIQVILGTLAPGNDELRKAKPAARTADAEGLKKRDRLFVGRSGFGESA